MIKKLHFHITRLQFTLLSVALIILVCGTLGIISYQNSSKALLDNNIQALVGRATDNADLVSSQINGFKNNVEELALDDDLYTMEWEKQKSYLISRLERFGVSRFQVADLTGFTYSTNGDIIDISDRDHFKNALKGETTITDPLKSKVKGEIVIICAVPIKNHHGQIKGVLTAALNPQYLFNLIKNRKVGNTGYGFILNNQGIIIAHPDEKLILEQTDVGKSKDFEGFQAIKEKMDNRNSGIGYYSYKGIDMCIAYAPIPDTNWSLALTAPKSEIFSGINALKSKFMFATLTAIIIGIAFNFLFWKYFYVHKRSEELKKNVEESTKLLNESAELDKLKTQFFANISHEFRTPLNVILSVLQLFSLHITNADSLNVEYINRHLKIMKQNCQRLLRLVSNLIDASKIDTGFMEVNLENRNIVSLVEDITLSIAEFVKMKEIELVFDTETEEKIIACDVDKVERIMLNLLSNAVKFSNPGGHIFVNIIDKGNFVSISIKDTGVGIAKEKQEEIFERFKQIDNTLARSHEGSGIGLSLVKSFVEMHEGSVSVNSEIGQGSEFIVELPAKLIPAEQEKFESKKIEEKDCANIEKMSVEFSDIYLQNKNNFEA